MIKNKKDFSKVLTKSFLEIRYTKNKLTQDKIAKIVGCSSSHIRKYLRKYSITIRPTGNIPEDLSGRRYGKWLVLERVGKTGPKSSYRYKCKCDCGTIKTIHGTMMVSGESRSCGCTQKEELGPKAASWKGGKYISATYFSQIRRGAKLRDIVFELTIDDLDNLIENQKFKCALSAQPIEDKIYREGEETTASLDRIDSNKGYVKDNIQWVQKDVNRMKHAFNNKYFIDTCIHIANNHREKYD